MYNRIIIVSPARSYVALEYFVSRGDCLLGQVGGSDVWPGRYPVAMGISAVVVHDCHLRGDHVPEPGSESLVYLWRR